MVGKALNLIKVVFVNCADWTDKLLDAVDGKGVVMAAFMIVLVISLLFMPLRGSMMSSFSDFDRQFIHKRRKSSGKKSSGKKSS